MTKCHYCGIHDIEPHLRVANACRSCSVTIWKMALAAAGREA